ATFSIPLTVYKPKRLIYQRTVAGRQFVFRMPGRVDKLKPVWGKFGLFNQLRVQQIGPPGDTMLVSIVTLIKQPERLRRQPQSKPFSQLARGGLLWRFV